MPEEGGSSNHFFTIEFSFPFDGSCFFLRRALFFFAAAPLSLSDVPPPPCWWYIYFTSIFAYTINRLYPEIHCGLCGGGQFSLRDFWKDIFVDIICQEWILLSFFLSSLPLLPFDISLERDYDDDEATRSHLFIFAAAPLSLYDVYIF